MAILISTTASLNDAVTIGTGLNPITTKVNLTNAGGVTVSDLVVVYLVATGGYYSWIFLQPVNEVVGINWEVSSDGINFDDAAVFADMDASVGIKIKPAYLRAIVDNDGTIPFGSNIQCTAELVAREN